MADLEALARRSRRAAEWGRFRSASRVLFAIGPFTLLALTVSPSRGTVVGVALALLIVTVGFGWWNAEGARAARCGLKLGAIPMFVALSTIAVERWCDLERAVTSCGIGCLIAGMLSGAASAWYAVRSPSSGRLRIWSEIGLVTSLTTALGCVGLGLGSALAILGAVGAGAAIAWVPAGVRTS